MAASEGDVPRFQRVFLVVFNHRQSVRYRRPGHCLPPPSVQGHCASPKSVSQNWDRSGLGEGRPRW